MQLHDGPADVEADPHAVGLGGDEGVEQAAGDAVVDPGPAVGDGEHRVLAVAGERDGEEPPLGRNRRHGLRAVAQEVEQHLLDQDAIGHHGGEVRRDLHVDPEPGRAGVDGGEGHRLVHEFGQVHRAEARLALLHEVLDAADDGAGPLGLRRQLLQRAFERLGIGAVAPDQVERPRRIGRDGGERLVQFVGERGRHLAEGDEPSRALQALGLPPRELHGRLAVGDVDDRSHPAAHGAVRVHQRRLVDQRIEDAAVRPAEAGLPARRLQLAMHLRVVTGAGGVDLVGQPVGHRRVAADKILGRVAHHAAEGGVHVEDAPVRVARAHADREAVLHRAAEGGLGQELLFGEPAPRHVALQEHEREDRKRRQARDGGVERVAGPVARLTVGSDGEFGAAQRRVEGDAVDHVAVRRLDARLLRQDPAGGVEQPDGIAFGDPPGHVAFDEAGHGHHGDDGALSPGLVGDRNREIRGQLAALAGDEIAVDGAGRETGPTGDLRESGRQRRVVGEVRDGGAHPTIGVDPGDGGDLRVVGHHQPRALLEAHGAGAAPRAVDRQPGDGVLVGGELEPQGLFHPERVGDQGGAGALAVLAVEEGDEEGEDGQQQQDGHDRHGREHGIAPPPGRGQRFQVMADDRRALANHVRLAPPAAGSPFRPPRCRHIRAFGSPQ